MIPQREQIEFYKNDIENLAKDFSVSERTARRWLEHYGFFDKKKNYGSCKLNRKIAKEIRAKYQNERLSIKELAIMYSVTFATISRIIDNITYPSKDVSSVSVICNPLCDKKLT